MDNTSLPPEILWKIISILGGVVVFLIGAIVSVFGYLHRQLIKDLEQIHNDLKPLLLSIALHKQKIDDILVRMDRHEDRISELEKRK